MRRWIKGKLGVYSKRRGIVGVLEEEAKLEDTTRDEGGAVVVIKANRGVSPGA
jgi:hypothetical protein